MIGIANITSTHPIDPTVEIHSVHFGRMGRDGWLKLDNQSNATGQSAGALTGLNSNSELFIGGFQFHETDFTEIPEDAHFDVTFTGT